MKTTLVLLIGIISGSVLTHWVHPFANVATYVEVQKSELEVRADNYKRCMQNNVYMNGKNKVETEWKCKNGNVFYTTAEVKTYYKEKN